MTALTLRWRRAPRALRTRWRVGSMASVLAAADARGPIAVILGRPGERGPVGPVSDVPGPPGPKGDPGLTIVPDIVDGGNF